MRTLLRLAVQVCSTLPVVLSALLSPKQLARAEGSGGVSARNDEATSDEFVSECWLKFKKPDAA
jgi:hypothetical protein